jgi:novel plant SNARE
LPHFLLSLLFIQTDIQYWDDTLTEEIDVIQGLVEDIPKIPSGMEKTAAIERCKAKVRSAAGTKRSFKMEIRLVQDVGQRRKYEGRLAQLDQQLKTLQADCKAMESESARGELFVEADEQFAAGNLNGNNGMDGVKAGDNMLKEAHGLQDKTQDSLANTKTMIADSKEVGAATLEELERQRQVIQNIEKETDRIDDNLARAEALLKQFGKRMASDHFIQCFALINCLLLVGVVLYAVIKGKNLNPTANKPLNPANTTRLLLRAATAAFGRRDDE